MSSLLSFSDLFVCGFGCIFSLLGCDCSSSSRYVLLGLIPPLQFFSVSQWLCQCSHSNIFRFLAISLVRVTSMVFFVGPGLLVFRLVAFLWESSAMTPFGCVPFLPAMFWTLFIFSLPSIISVSDGEEA